PVAVRPGQPERRVLRRRPSLRRHHLRGRAQGDHPEPGRLVHRPVVHLIHPARVAEGPAAPRPPRSPSQRREPMTAQAVRPKGQRPEDERLRFGANFAYGLQHVLTMYGGIIAVPLIIGQAAGLGPTQIGLLIAAGLFIGGLATLLQAWGLPFFGSQLPLVQGVSFAGVSTMLAIMSSSDLADASPDEKLQAVFGAVIGASVIGLIIAPFFAKIVRFFPPV